MQKNYQGKILFFGEYSVLIGSDALVVPYKRFQGNWTFDELGKKELVFKNLAGHLSHLSDQFQAKYLKVLFESDINQGLKFKSTIPMSSGLGSSGALSAGIYDQYFEGKPEKSWGLKSDLSMIESFFHGNSSGIDPLCSYLNEPLLIQKPNIVEKVKFNTDVDLFDVFLIDTLDIGKTSKLVTSFKSKWENQEYVYFIMNEYTPVLNDCINSFINQDESFMQHIEKLSKMQFNLFEEMIPEGFEDIWEESLQSDLYKMKICGSGGGGFLLGFTKNFYKCVKHFEKYPYPLLKVNLR